MLLEQGLLPDIHRLSKYDFLKNGAPAHCLRYTVASLHSTRMCQKSLNWKKTGLHSSGSKSCELFSVDNVAKDVVSSQISDAG